MSEEQLIAEVGISTVCMKRMDMSTSELASCITWKLQKKKKNNQGNQPEINISN